VTLKFCIAAVLLLAGCSGQRAGHFSPPAEWPPTKRETHPVIGLNVSAFLDAQPLPETVTVHTVDVPYVGTGSLPAPLPRSEDTEVTTHLPALLWDTTKVYRESGLFAEVVPDVRTGLWVDVKLSEQQDPHFAGKALTLMFTIMLVPMRFTQHYVVETTIWDRERQVGSVTKEETVTYWEHLFFWGGLLSSSPAVFADLNRATIGEAHAAGLF
jgi:hypothetical protein